MYALHEQTPLWEIPHICSVRQENITRRTQTTPVGLLRGEGWLNGASINLNRATSTWIQHFVFACLRVVVFTWIKGASLDVRLILHVLVFTRIREWSSPAHSSGASLLACIGLHLSQECGLSMNEVFVASIKLSSKPEHSRLRLNRGVLRWTIWSFLKYSGLYAHVLIIETCTSW